MAEETLQKFCNWASEDLMASSLLLECFRLLTYPTEDERHEEENQGTPANSLHQTREEGCGEPSGTADPPVNAPAKGNCVSPEELGKPSIFRVLVMQQ